MRRCRGSDWLQLPAYLGDVAEISDVDLRGERAAARISDDEPLAFEVLERLAHRRPAEAQLAAELVVIDGRAGPDLEHDEPVTNDLVRLLGEGRRLAAHRTRRHAALLRPELPALTSSRC